jgi:hypothetical protein
VVVQIVARRVVVAARLAPRPARIVRSIHVGAFDEAFAGRHRAAVRIARARRRHASSLVVVHKRVQRVRVRPRDVDPDTPAELGRRQALARVGPGLTAVGRLRDAAFGVPRLDARIAPLAAHALPHCGIERVRIARIHHEIDRARARAFEIDGRPGLAAVSRLVDAAHVVVGPLVPRGGDVHDVGIRRMHEDARDRLRVRQPHVLPRAARVGRFVDPDARHRRAEDVRLAGADPHDVGIARRHREVADARRRHLIEHRLPRRAVVIRLPHAARRIRGIDAALTVPVGDRRIRRSAADIGRAQIGPAHRPVGRRLSHRRVGVIGLAEELGVGLDGRLRAERQDREARDDEDSQCAH